MKKKFLFAAMVALTFAMNAQEETEVIVEEVKEKEVVKKDNRLSAFTEFSVYNFQQYNYTLDINYRITDRVSLSSWNTITSGRTLEQGYNYSVVSGLLNFKSENLENTISVGYNRVEQYFYNFIDNQFVVKIRMKIL